MSPRKIRGGPEDTRRGCATVVSNSRKWRELGIVNRVVPDAELDSAAMNLECKFCERLIYHAGLRRMLAQSVIALVTLWRGRFRCETTAAVLRLSVASEQSAIKTSR